MASVVFDSNGYISSYANIGSFPDGVEMNLPDGIEEHDCRAYHLIDGALVLDSEREAALAAQEEEEETVTDAERIADLERSNAELRAAFEALLRGDTDA